MEPPSPPNDSKTAVGLTKCDEVTIATWSTLQRGTNFNRLSQNNTPTKNNLQNTFLSYLQTQSLFRDFLEISKYVLFFNNIYVLLTSLFFFFIVCTNDCQSLQDCASLFHIQTRSSVLYDFILWRNRMKLDLNVSKTNEMIISFNKKTLALQSWYISIEDK